MFQCSNAAIIFFKIISKSKIKIFFQIIFIKNKVFDFKYKK